MDPGPAKRGGHRAMNEPAHWHTLGSFIDFDDLIPNRVSVSSGANMLTELDKMYEITCGLDNSLQS